MKPEWIARQSSHPTGLVGHVVAHVMGWDTQSANAFARDALPVQSGDSVLEIGCGHGRGVKALATAGIAGRIVGVDPSDVMVRVASRTNRGGLTLGNVEIRQATAAHLPFPSASFDHAIAVHVLYFWREASFELREIRRVLREGGTFVLGFRPDSPEARAELPPKVYTLRSVPEVEKLLSEANFAVGEVMEGPASSGFVRVRAEAT